MGIPMLLSIVEMGGYPDFTSLYRRAGYRPEKVHSMRNAQAWLKKNRPEVVVAEFHFDPELRDRMSNLESLLAGLQRFAPQAKVIVFIERAHRTRLEKVRTRYAVRGALDYPIEETALEELLNAIATED
ncbi:MAG: hypothetical protein KDI74_13485 [Gammaproteobacteria bacterium]|nr:hypothetical protein [Gammaproteobacteria bacterium]